MKFRFILPVCLFFFYLLYGYQSCLASEQDLKYSRDSTYQPIIDIAPKDITIPYDTSQFVVKQVKVLNRGGGILNVKQISGSCYCSHGVIVKNDVYPLDLGELRLEINKEGLANKDDIIIFTVTSNAVNSPFFLKVKFVIEEKGEEEKEKGDGDK